MRVFEVTDRSDWQDTSDEFLQQWEYGDFLARAGRNVGRLKVEGGEGPTYIQYLAYTMPFGITHVYLPRVDFSKEVGKALFAFFQAQGVVFARIDPTMQLRETGWEEYDVQRAPSRQVQHTWILDVTPIDEVLLEAMHHKTRYNIRLAKKRGVEIRAGKDVETFWKLRAVTLARNEFDSHPRAYYEKMYELSNLHQLTAYYNGEPIAVVLQLHVGDKLIYIHGASGNEHRNVMAPYLLQWESIQLAKQLGCTEYDFWGTAKPVAKDEKEAKVSWHHGFYWDATHPWSGVARFKAGFGGEVRTYPEAVDVIFSKTKYRLYLLVKRFVRSV